MEQVEKSTTFLLDSFRRFKDTQAARMGAALSYYAIFAITPLAILIMSLVVAVYGESIAEESVISQFDSSIGFGAGDFLRLLLEGFAAKDFSLLGIILTIVAVLFATINFFFVLRGTLDAIFGVPQSFKRETVIDRIARSVVIFSVIPLAALLFLLLVSFGVFASAFQFTELFIVEIGFLFLLGTAFFSFIYKVIPKRKLTIKEVLFGGTLTSLLFIIGRSAIVLYIATVAQPTIFGAASSFVVILIWIYYSAQVLFFSAACVHVFSERNKKTPIE